MTFTAKDFYSAVAAMREAQKQYFKTRDVSVLNQAKALEREVDGMLEKIRAGQGELL